MLHVNLSNYKIIFSKKAEKFLYKLDKQSRKLIVQKLRELQGGHQNLNIKKLKSRHRLYRLRVGNLRVIYSLKHNRVVIYIVAVGLRKDIYQSLNFA